MDALVEQQDARAPENAGPARYLTMGEIMSGKLSLDELMDAPWATDGRSLRQWFSGR